MRGDKIPDQHHIARLCNPKHISEEQIQATAFMLRKNEKSLSVNWMEFLNCSSRGSEIIELQNIYSRKLKVAASAIIGVLNVWEVREKVFTESLDRRNLEILHDPQLNDTSHSGIFNLKDDDILIAELILKIVRETYPTHQ